MPALEVTRRGRAVVLVLAVAACTSSDSDAVTPTTAETTTTTAMPTTTAPERETSTTTTEFDPASVEGQVEAAYLKSWDVYADAVYNLELDEKALSTVYGGDHLSTKREEIGDRIEEGRSALVAVEHDYTIQVIDRTTVVLIDRFQNHQVLIDKNTREPIEPDPDVEVSDVVTLRLFGEQWKVIRKERLG